MDIEQTSGVTLFTSANLDVLYFPAERHDVIAVTFTPLKNGRKPWGNAFFSDRGVPCICFVSGWDHWWQVAEMGDAIASVFPIVSNYKRRVTYGTSMGAYGALRFSKELDATDVIAFSPQFSIDQRKVPFEKRWQTHARKLDFAHDDMNKGLAQARIFLGYDPRNADGEHVSLIDAPDATHFAIPYSGHSSISLCHSAKVLAPIVMSVVNGGKTKPSKYHSKLRDTKRQDASYWAILARKAAERQRRDAAVTYSLRSIISRPDVFHNVLTVARSLDAVADYRGAVHFYMKALAFDPGSESIKDKATKALRKALRDLLAKSQHAAAKQCLDCYPELVDQDVALRRLAENCQNQLKRLQREARRVQNEERLSQKQANSSLREARRIERAAASRNAELLRINKTHRRAANLLRKNLVTLLAKNQVAAAKSVAASLLLLAPMDEIAHNALASDL